MMKDRSHYGLLVEDKVLLVTPEQADTWLHTRPPAPIMWSRGAANNAKARRYADSMLAGEWNNDLPVEPVQISLDHGYVLGGHHRLTAVTLIKRPQELRIMFWTKPQGWDQRRREDPKGTHTDWMVCSECGWWAGTVELVESHITRTHAGTGSVYKGEPDGEEQGTAHALRR